MGALPFEIEILLEFEPAFDACDATASFGADEVGA